MRPLRLVLDTNIYISAALKPESFIYKLVLDSVANNLASYYSSPEILLELQDKLENKFSFSRANAVKFINRLEKSVTVVRPLIKLEVVERDADDDKILECAVEVNADLVVSADKDLISLKIYEGIKILHPNSLKYIFPQLSSSE
jgi:uncharacterized protein